MDVSTPFKMEEAWMAYTLLLIIFIIGIIII
jgi:hypothetical protein